MCKQTANTRWCESLPGQGDCFTSVICMKMSTRFPLGQPATAYDQSQGNATFVEYLLPVQCKQRFFLGQQIPFNLRRTYNLNKIFVLHDNMSISISECVSVCVHLCVCVRACVRACVHGLVCAVQCTCAGLFSNILSPAFINLAVSYVFGCSPAFPILIHPAPVQSSVCVRARQRRHVTRSTAH